MWGILLAAAGVVLLLHFNSKNAVWGTATLGALIGVIIAVIQPGFDWWIVGKSVTIATFIGLALEMLPRLANRLRSRA